MGSPLRGRGLFVLDRNEGLVSPFGSGTLVSSLLDLTRPVSQGVLPGGPRCVRELRLSLAPSSVLHCPMLGFSVASTTLAAGLGLSWVPCPTFGRLGFCTSVGGSAWAPGRRSASRSTCFALPDVSRLFFGLGAFSFGWGFGLCLPILLAACGCRCDCCDPPCGCESERVLPSLLGPSPSGVCHLSRVCFSVGGPVRVAHSFHTSLLLGGGLVRFCGGLWWRSLAMSWACTQPFLCVVLLIDPVALSPLLHRVFADGFRHWCAFRLCGGPSPHAFGSVGALGELQWLHLYRLTLDLVGLCQFAVWLWSSGRCSLFSCATFRTYTWRSFCQFPWLLRVPTSYLP